jgi:rubrerythrin
MTLDRKLRPDEILAAAVRSEIEAADFYGGLLGRVKNILLRQKLSFLVTEEKKHRQILERLHGQRFPGIKLKIPDKPAGPKAPAAWDEKATVLDLFKLALEAERLAEQYYKDARGVMADAGSKKMLEYLSRVERSHYFLIKSEIDLLGRFPDYYDAEDFHLGEDLFHVGP